MGKPKRRGGARRVIEEKKLEKSSGRKRKGESELSLSSSTAKAKRRGGAPRLIRKDKKLEKSRGRELPPRDRDPKDGESSLSAKRRKIEEDKKLEEEDKKLEEIVKRRKIEEDKKLEERKSSLRRKIKEYKKLEESNLPPRDPVAIGASSSCSSEKEHMTYSLGVSQKSGASSSSPPPRVVGDLYPKGNAGVPDEDSVILSSLREFIKRYAETRPEFQVQPNKLPYNSPDRVNPFAEDYMDDEDLTGPRKREKRIREIPGMITGLVSFQYLRCFHEPDGVVDVADTSFGITHVPIFINKVGPLCKGRRERVHDPLFILLVESEPLFLTLGFQRFYDRFPCVMLHSWRDEQGCPDYATRWLVKKLHSELRLPVLALTHCDPQGMKILSIYKWGLESDTLDLNIPDLVWLGLTPRDMIEHGIPDFCTLSVSPEDVDIAIKFHAELKDIDLKRTMHVLMSLQRKAEVDALACQGGHPYIALRYLPLKLQKLSISDPRELQKCTKLCLEDPL